MPTILTIGNFDGVHRGHRALLDAARQRADALDGQDARVVAITFDPHPATLLRPERVPPRLLGRDEKTARLKDAGADQVITLTPTPDLLARSPEEFIAHLVEAHQPAAFVEGPNFRFGHRAAGNTDTLTRLGRQLGFTTHIVEPCRVGLTDQLDAPLSSTLIRQLVTGGRVADAALALSRPFDLTATVIPGEQRGRTIGVPTLNLSPQDLQGFVLPGDGVYAGHVTLPDGRVFPSAISVGVKPTFGRQQRIIEAHLIGFDEDAYNQRVTVALTRWLRDQSRFPGIDALQQQLHRDIARAADYADRDLLLPPAASHAPTV